MIRSIISIIIPAYNIEKYVGYAIKSVISQTMIDWELIIVDDGSTDNTGIICDSFAKQDDRIIVYHTLNQGVSAARNIGLEHAKSEHVIFLDGDDIYDSIALETLFHDMNSNYGIILACSEATKIQNHKWNNKEISNKVDYYSSKKAISKLLSGTMEVGVWGKLFIRNRIGRLRFVEGRSANEDKYFVFEYLLNNSGAVSYRKDRLYGYFMRQGSLTKADFNSRSLDALYFSELMIKETRGKLPECLPDAEFQDFVRHLEILKHIIRTEKYYEEKEIYNKVKRELIRRYTGRPASFYRKYYVEYRIQEKSDLLYRVCVRLIDSIKHKNK